MINWEADFGRSTSFALPKVVHSIDNIIYELARTWFSTNSAPSLDAKIFCRPQRYTGEDIRLKVKKYGIELEVVKRREKKGFVLKARKWIMERIFARL